MRRGASRGPGDGSGLRVFDTDIGRLGGLICYEHHMPPVKYALYRRGKLVHAAVWPNRWQYLAGPVSSGRGSSAPRSTISSSRRKPLLTPLDVARLLLHEERLAPVNVLPVSDAARAVAEGIPATIHPQAVE
jgi:predicted amidohydrolase